MKHISFYVAFSTIAAILTFNSCKKEELVNANDTNIAERISKYIYDIENGSNLKSQRFMAIDSVIWYTEASLNYKHSQSNISFSELAFETSLIAVDYQDGDIVAFDEVIRVQREMKQKIKTHFKNIGNPKKHMRLVDVKLVEKNPESKKATLVVKTAIGVGDPTVLVLFGATDWWYYGWSQGKCSAYTGGVGSDAAKEIEWRINNSIVYPANTTFTDVYTAYEINPLDYPNPTDTIAADNWYDYLMYFNEESEFLPQSQQTFHTCLSPTENRFYLNGTRKVMNMYAPAGPRPIGKTIMAVTLWGDFFPADTQNAMHRGNFTYGVAHTAKDRVIEDL